MVSITLTASDQRALRAVLAADPVPGSPVPDRPVLQRLAELVPCDRVVVSLLDAGGAVVEETTVGLGRPSPADTGSSAEVRGRSAVGELVVSGQEDGTVVRLRLVRTRGGFGERDVALLHLLAPVLERLLRERPVPRLPSTLTVSERRVLQQAAAGLSNARIAERLFIAPSTVRKHLEHSYRKLGVSSRMAALARLQGRDGPGLDLLARAGDPR
jgi:DNA-binding CsgD family transcriptional regulator